MFKKVLKIATLFFLFLIFANIALAQGPVSVYFFYSDSCPHCAKEELFLDELEKENQNIKVYRYEVGQNKNNARFLSDLAEKLNWDISAVPFTAVGGRTFVGFYDAETTGAEIRAAANDCLRDGCQDAVAAAATGGYEESGKENYSQNKINLPLFGEVNLKKFSLPLLTLMMAVLDGFNPCAMWVLLFLISLLLGAGDRKKKWAVGLTFIFVSALFYFGVLLSWLHVLLIIGFIFWIRVAIALAALAAGGYNLKKYWRDRKGVCEVIDEEKRRDLFGRLRSAVGKNLWPAILGTAILAISVNFIELVCSAGLPAVYTQVLAMAQLPAWQHYFYLAAYSLIFISGQLLIFLAAMFTLKLKAIGAGYMRWTRLIGGIIMVVIGLLLLFKPTWLMFG